jgi:hypothetical protein
MRRYVSFFLVLIAACGGSQPEPKTPTTDSADLVRDGSSAPDPTAAASLPATDTPKSEPVKTSAVSNTADGSDIVPPFTSSTPDQDKKAAPKPTKKKKKKKQT